MTMEEEFEIWFNAQSPMFARGNRVIAYAAWQHLHEEAKMWRFVRSEVAKENRCSEFAIQLVTKQRMHKNGKA